MKARKVLSKVRKAFPYIVAIIILATGAYLFNRFSYSKEYDYYQISDEQQNDSIIKIAIIGDSWVAGEKLDSTIHAILMDNKISNTVISSGQPGAKTKKIYANLFSDSKFIIENKPQYCVIVAGVNDALGETGKGFYTNHMVKIIKTLIHYGIKPVVLELPMFGIEQTTKQMNVVQRYRNVIFSYFTNHGKIDDIENYRIALNEELKAQRLKDKIIFIPFKICSEYSDCPQLYRNTSHLSYEGNVMLGTLISESILKSKTTISSQELAKN